MTATTEIGKVTVDVPRDREGSFDPQIVAKHQRRLAGFDEAVISLHGKGMTTGDIAELEHFRHFIIDANSLALAGVVLSDGVDPSVQRRYREHLVVRRRAGG